MLLFYSTALECIKELIVRCKYDTLMQLIEKEDCWKLFEEEKTFPDGVVLIARYVNTSGHFLRRLCSLIFSRQTRVKRALHMTRTQFNQLGSYEVLDRMRHSSRLVSRE